MAQRPEGALLQGAKVTSRFSGESEPLMRRATESLSVMHLLSTQRRARCGAWCEERAGQPLAPEQRDKPGASSYQQGNPENKGGDVKRAGASARTSEHDRPIFVIMVKREILGMLLILYAADSYDISKQIKVIITIGSI